MKKILILILFLLTINVYAKEPVILKKCVDGDTMQLIINNQKRRVRLLSVDTPESVDEVEVKEPFGKEASEFTCNLLKNAKEITIEYDSKSDHEDKYGRVLAYVYVDDKMIQEELLAKGLAKVAYVYNDYDYLERFREIEAQAKEDKLGIWSDEEYVYEEHEEDDLEEDIDNIFEQIYEFFVKIFRKIGELFS